MGLITRNAHFYFEIIVFIISSILGLLVLYLVKTRTPKYLRSYSKMIMWNTIIDLFFCVVSVVLMGTLDVRSGLLYIVVDNPYHPVDPCLGSFSASLWTFALYLTVIAIPIQFIYRYGIIARSKPFSRTQLSAIIGVFLIYMVLHAFLCPATMHSRAKEYDDILELNPIFKGNLPSAYLVGDARTFTPYSLHALNCQLVLIICYTVTIIFGYKTFKSMKYNRVDLSEERVEMQTEISRIMVLQAIYPVIAMVIPLFFLAAVPFMHDEHGKEYNFSWLGMVGIGLVNLIPILNCLSVIFVIPQYRQALCS